MTPEAKVCRRVDSRLSIMGCHVYNINMVSQIGVPDRIGLKDGRFFALEIKASRRAKRSKLQEYNIKKIRSYGGFAEFIYPENFDQVMDSLEQYLGDQK